MPELNVDEAASAGSRTANGRRAPSPAARPPGASPLLDTPTLRELLSRMVEGEIVPRMMLAHRTRGDGSMRGEPRVDPAASARLLREAEASASAGRLAAAAARVADVAVHGDVEDLIGEIDALVAAGVDLAAVHLHVLAPAARRLGALWEQDLVSFVDVTIGLGRLQRVMHRGAIGPADDRAPSALFLTAPGEQHSFGVLMAEEIFRRAGWRTACEPDLDEAGSAAAAVAARPDLVGVGVSCEAHLDAATRLVARLRAVCGPDVRILLGGLVFHGRSELALAMGADCAAAGAEEAAALAARLIGPAAERL